MATKKKSTPKASKDKGKKKLNRIKEVLVEQGRNQKWLAEKMDVEQNTTTNWCANSTQPRLSELKKIAELLGVSMCDLLNEEK